MSLLTDFIIAKNGEENVILEAENRNENWNVLQLTNMDPVKIQTLYNAIQKRDLHTDEDYELTPHEGHADEGPRLFKIPDNLLDVLAISEDADIHTIVDTWLMSDELQMEWRGKEDTQEVVENIASFARQAKEKDMELYLWMSL